MQRPPHLRLTEADAALRDALAEVLVREGYRVEVASRLRAVDAGETRVARVPPIECSHAGSW